MKTNILFLFILFSIQCFAQQTKESDTTKCAFIKFEETNHNFDTLNKGDACFFEYKFWNVGNQALIINYVYTSCGCDVATWPREPILPGESGIIKYKYDSQRIGAFHKTTTVSSNAKNSTVVLTVKGMIKDIKAPADFNLNVNLD